MRPEYVEDIFRCLSWLGIEWQQGPQNMQDFEALAPIEERTEHYFERMEAMIAAGLPAFVCRCSRRDLGRDARCEKGCFDRHFQLTEGKSAARVRMPESEPTLRKAMGDFIVWRREDLPAYQLQSLIDDEEMGITHIVRGEDLLDSTLAQRYLAGFIPDAKFLRADIRHHALIVGESGEKLSKSQGTERLDLSPELRTMLDDAVAKIAL